jgi:hypothetical protein
MERPHVAAQKLDERELVPRDLDTNVLDRHRRDDRRLLTGSGTPTRCSSNRDITCQVRATRMPSPPAAMRPSERPHR